MLESLHILSKLAIQYITLTNMSFVLGLIGSAGTVWAIIQNRTKFDIRIAEYSYKENKIVAYLIIQNKSRLPISIGKICVKIDNSYYPCVETPTRIRWDTYRSGKTITGQANYYNLDIPISLLGLMGTSGYILFELPPEIDILDPTTLTLQISPNRGSAVEKKCQIPQQHTI